MQFIPALNVDNVAPTKPINMRLLLVPYFLRDSIEWETFYNQYLWRYTHECVEWIVGLFLLTSWILLFALRSCCCCCQSKSLPNNSLKQKKAFAYQETDRTTTEFFVLNEIFMPFSAVLSVQASRKSGFSFFPFHETCSTKLSPKAVFLNLEDESQ